MAARSKAKGRVRAERGITGQAAKEHEQKQEAKQRIRIKKSNTGERQQSGIYKEQDGAQSPHHSGEPEFYLGVQRSLQPGPG